MNFTDAVRESMARFLKGRLNLSEIAETQGEVRSSSPLTISTNSKQQLEDMTEEDEADESNS
jgi:hypothetical protein